MPSPLTKKLSRGAVLDDSDRAAVEGLSERVFSVSAKEPLILEGDFLTAVYVVSDGWACRFKELPGKSRQIIGFLVPGDHVAPDFDALHRIDYTVCALTKCEIIEISADEFRTMLDKLPNVRGGFRWASRVDEAILREWLLSLGRRPAERRLAHLLCELHLRLLRVGKADAAGFALPLTQVTLGDALGLSPAHVNRSLQSLRTRNLARFENGAVEVPSIERLQKFAAFNGRYLQLNDASHPKVEA